MSEPLYVVGPDSTRYRVHDELWSQNAAQSSTPIPAGSDARALHRMFVTDDDAVYMIGLSGNEWQTTPST